MIGRLRLPAAYGTSQFDCHRTFRAGSQYFPVQHFREAAEKITVKSHSREFYHNLPIWDVCSARSWETQVMPTDIRILGVLDARVLESVAPGVFVQSCRYSLD